MIFVPAAQPGPVATPLAWCFGFVEGKLLLPEGEAPELAPASLLGLEAAAHARHYLARSTRSTAGRWPCPKCRKVFSRCPCALR